MTKKDRHELFDKYLKNQLDGIPLRKFEQELESDELLQKELSFEIELREALGDQSHYTIFKDLVNEAGSEYFQQPARKVWPMGWAAAIAVLLVSTLVWKVYFDLSPDQYYQKHFKPYEAPGILRGDASLLDENMIMGLIKYEKGEYQDAIKAFDLVTKKDSLNYTADFLKAVSYMALKDLARAEPIFKKIINNESNIFNKSSQNYLGILYLSDSLESNDDLGKIYLVK